MGSVHTPDLWSPNAVYRDCSQGICSIYCPQWCYIIYPPPPPSISLGDDPDDDSSGFEFSPLIVAVIGILACAFILATYYTIISRFCRRRGQISDQTSQLDENGDPLNTQLAQVSSSSGLDEALIKSITVCKYKKGDGLVECTDCSVCLSEFQENESLRLLPKCNHAFHLPCIDTWLKSHSSCPLCRSNLSSSTCSLPNLREAQIQEAPPPTSMRVSAMEYQHRNDTVIVIQGSEQSLAQEIVVSFGAEDAENLEERNGFQMNSCTNQCRVSVADILNAGEKDEESQREELDVGSSRGIEGEEREENGKGTGLMNMVRSPMGIKRSASTGRFVITRHGKGKNSMVSN